jgi:phosphatidylglycerophosphate synthase
LRLLVAGYLVYWVGDMADGAVARWRDEKTREGAVFDIISDRACTTMLATAFVVQQPAMAVPLALFLVQFCVVDTMLSLGFLYWPVDSPNDFHLVDRTLWRLNWSPPAKAVNTAAVVLLVWSGSAVIAAAVALGLTTLKVWSLRRMVGLLDIAVPIDDQADERADDAAVPEVPSSPGPG